MHLIARTGGSLLPLTYAAIKVTQHEASYLHASVLFFGQAAVLHVNRSGKGITYGPRGLIASIQGRILNSGQLHVMENPKCMFI